MHLVLDADGVLLDWFGGFYSWMASSGRPSKHSVGTAYELVESWPDLSPEAIQALITDFSESPEFESIPSMPGAEDFLREFRRQHPNVKIAVVTNVGTSFRSQASRLYNLARFCVDELYMLPRHAPKTETFKRFKRFNTIVVDDNPRCLAEAQNASLIPVAFDYPFNRAIAVSRIKCWADARERVTDVYHQLKRCAA